MKHLLRIFLAMCLVTGPAHAWETQVDGAGPNPWRSLYQLDPPEPIKGLIRPRAMTDEHTRLSDMALEKLGVGGLFARGGRAKMSIVDLNASLFRRAALDGLPTVGDDETTPLEERLIPPPAHFSGVPDYSFTIYDWLNKNQLCPPGPMGNRCHEYMFGWLGNLNATHFGSQATGMYRHYHAVAVGYAARAREMHLAARISGNGEHEAYLDHIREAELEALAYEGYAQHFLQDRWALGHMWERWNGPDPGQIPTPDNLANTVVSAVAGLMHGSESVLAGNNTVSIPEEVNAYMQEFLGVDLGTDSVDFKFGDALLAADPMSSPIIRDDKVYPLRWRHQSQPNLAPIPGAGDDRLFDIVRKKFGFSYGYFDLGTLSYVELKDKDFVVDQQFDEMLACSAAGYAEVIKAFGKFDGAYGAWKASLVDGAPEFDVITRETCWDMWATNEAMYEGFSNSGTITADVVGGLVYAVDLGLQLGQELLGEDALGTVPKLPRSEILKVLARMKILVQDDPFGTQLARGEIGPFDVFDTGDLYGLPSYAHPDLLKDLPEDSENGLDRKTLSGAFSRAHSDYWCENMGDTLRDLRGQEEPHKIAACEYLAGFAYGGTEEGYNGSLRERLLFNGKEIKSLCAVRGVADGSVLDTPSRLPPGYVDAQRGADALSPSGMGRQSLANWCARVPVLRLSSDPALADQNLVAEIDPETETLTLIGIDLGQRAGRISVTAGGKTRRLGDVLDWNEDVVTLDIKGDLDGDTTYDLEVFRADDDATSVGLFQLRTLPEKERPPVTLERLVGVGPCRIPLNIEVLPNPEFLAFFESWRGLDSDSVKEYIPRAQDFFDQSIAILEREADCIDALRVKNVLPNWEPKTGTEQSYLDTGRPTFLDEARFRAVVLDDARVGDRQFLSMENSAFTRAWDFTDQILYLDDAETLRVTAEQFRDQMKQLEQAVADIERLEQSLRQKPDPGIEAQLDFHRATLWEQFLPVHQAAPVYMAYLGPGLNRWAVAEDRLMRVTFPRMMGLIEGRLTKLESLVGQPCGPTTEVSYQLHNAPISIAAATPHFTGFTPGAVPGPHSTHLHYAAYDRFPLRWDTPKRLIETVGWQVDPHILDRTQNLPPAKRGCPQYDALNAAVAEMANYDAVYGDQAVVLMSTGALYDRLSPRTISFLPDTESETSCLRCEKLEFAIEVYDSHLQDIARKNDTSPIGYGVAEAMEVFRPTGKPYLEARKAVLEQELAQCQNICIPVEVAPLGMDALPPGVDPALIAFIDGLIVTYKEANMSPAIIEKLKEMRQLGEYDSDAIMTIMMDEAKRAHEKAMEAEQNP